ncbi:hypothetical protein [Cohnella algarum]|uniref:hypothetical protein n=1 Tax=Cohnella algarum TaxID=2044859 RepID=UPI001967504D|nr:hypothetical protein [Cohnella algarum]MBN2980216.1 hypothetical protein [Cohnella algarum]
MRTGNKHHYNHPTFQELGKEKCLLGDYWVDYKMSRGKFVCTLYLGVKRIGDGSPGSFRAAFSIFESRARQTELARVRRFGKPGGRCAVGEDEV